MKNKYFSRFLLLLIVVVFNIIDINNGEPIKDSVYIQQSFAGLYSCNVKISALYPTNTIFNFTVTGLNVTTSKFINIGDANNIYYNFYVVLLQGQNSVKWQSTLNGVTTLDDFGIFYCQTMTSLNVMDLVMYPGDSSTYFTGLVNLDIPKNSTFLNYICPATSSIISCSLSPLDFLDSGWFTINVILNDFNIAKFPLKFYQASTPTINTSASYPIPYLQNIGTTSMSYISNPPTKSKSLVFNLIAKFENLNSLIHMDFSTTTLTGVLGNTNDNNAVYNIFNRKLTRAGVRGINTLNIIDSKVLTSNLPSTQMLTPNIDLSSSYSADTMVDAYIVSCTFKTTMLGTLPITLTVADIYSIKSGVSYPQGFTSIPNNSTGYNVSYDTMIFKGYGESSAKLLYIFANYYYGSQGGSQINILPWSPPVIGKDFYLTYCLISALDANRFVLKLSFNFGVVSGLRSVNIYNTDVYSSSLILGSIYGGTLETVIDYTNLQKDARVIAESYGIATISVSYDDVININNVIPSLPSFIDRVRIEDIVSFKFEPNNLDVSNGSASTLLVFKLREPKLNYIPSIYIPMNNDLPDVINPKNVFKGYYNSLTQTYVIPITVREKLFTRSLSYNLTAAPISIPSKLIQLKFGDQGHLNVYSKFADEMGPIVKTIVQYPSNEVTIISNLTKNSIGWNFTLSDDSGFDHGYALITSDLDPIPFNISFDKSEAAENGEYHISIEVGNCRSTIYHIDMVLFDTLGNIANSSTEGAVIPQTNPFYLLYGDKQSEKLLDITLDCLAVPDLTPPEFISFFVLNKTVEIGALNRVFMADLQIKDSESSISLHPKDFPYIYFTEYNFKSFKIQASSVDIKSLPIVKFSFNQQIPYGAGMTGKLLLSIYGVSNNHRMLAGWSSTQLRAMGETYYVSTSFIPHPILEYADTLYESGGRLYIFGKRLNPPNSNITGEIVYIDQSIGNNSLYEPVKLLFSFSSVIQIFVDPIKLLKSSSIAIRVTTNNVLSNELIIPKVKNPPAPVKPTDAPLVCPGTPVPCSNNGICIDGLCQCNTAWTGPACQSKINIVPPPPVQPDQPTVVNVIKNNQTDNLVSRLTVHSLRELTPSGELVKNYTLANWIFENKTDSTNQFLYRYTVKIPTSNTNVSVDIQYFYNETVIQFGGRNLTMLPSTIKYTINLNAYTFSSKLNRLQLVMSTGLQTTSTGQICTLKQNSGDTQDLKWIKLNINEQSLYAKFLDVGEVDGTATIVSNSLLEGDEFRTADDSSTVESFVGINIPYYEYSIKLDPDFSLLIDSDPLGSDSKCGHKNKDDGGLSKGAIIGIVVGCVGLAAIIATLIIVIPKIKYSEMGIKMKSMMNKKDDE